MNGLFGSRPSLMAVSVSALTLIPALALTCSTAASASTHSDSKEKVQRTARVLDSQHCAKPAVEIVAGSESATFPLERCDGEAIPASVDKLSILARPSNAPKPKEPLAAGKPRGAEIAPGIRRIDARLAERLELVADHFRKEGESTRIVLVAPKSRSAGSYHASGRAIDFRIEGADNDAVVAFCKTVQDTGCGYYPNGGFVHMDVRDAGAGHVAWIDISKPGDAPKYVSAWPLPSEAPKVESGKVEASKMESAKAESPKLASAKGETAKTETAKETDTDDASKLPALPAAMQLAPMEASKAPKAAEIEAEPAPVKKHHRRHRHHDHTI